MQMHRADDIDSNAAQAKRWNGFAGRGWVETQDLTDQIFKPLEELLLDGASTGGRVLDVGCGTGCTTLAIARRNNSPSCTGIDISQPMISAARRRAEQQDITATFVCEDAQTYAFNGLRFDKFISRLGVMFFADPVKAFSNLRYAAEEDAQLRVIAWRGAEENPFITEAERAAAPDLPNLAPRQSGSPGPFAFADHTRVRDILKQSNWTQIEIESVDIECSLPESELVRYLTSLGPVAALLQELEAERSERILHAIRPTFAPYAAGDEIRFKAACWMISARARQKIARPLSTAPGSALHLPEA